MNSVDAFNRDVTDAEQTMADWAEMAAEHEYIRRPLGANWSSWLDRETGL
jgi:hypothetical protein